MARREKSRLLIRNCRFAFKCDAVWENLEQKRNPKIRFCPTCTKNVYLCEDDAELSNNIVKNRCVAIFRHEAAEMVLGKIMDPHEMPDQ
jgi:hypothetical protein